MVDRVVSGYDADRIDFVTTVDSLVPFRENDSERFRRADINEVGFCLRGSESSDDSSTIGASGWGGCMATFVFTGARGPRGPQTRGRM